MTVQKAGVIELSFVCSCGARWIALASYNPALGSLRLLTSEHEFCPNCLIEKKKDPVPSHPGITMAVGLIALALASWFAWSWVWVGPK